MNKRLIKSELRRSVVFLDLFFLFALSVIGASLVISNAEVVSHLFWVAAIIVILWFGTGIVLVN